jgi:hypothetical protein
VSGNETVWKDGTLQLTVYAEYIQESLEMTHKSTNEKGRTVLYITVRTDNMQLLKDETLQLLYQKEDGTYEDATQRLCLEISEACDILVGTMLIEESGNYIVKAVGQNGIVQSQTVEIKLHKEKPSTNSEETEQIEKYVPMVTATEAVDERRKNKKKANANGNEQAGKAVKETDTTQQTSPSDRVVSRKEEKTISIQKNVESKQPKESNQATQADKQKSALKEKLSKEGKKSVDTEQEKSIKETTIILEKKPTRLEDDIQRRGKLRIMQVVKVGVPMSAVVLLIAAMVLLLRRRNIVVLYGNSQSGQEEKLGELLLERREGKHALVIPAQLLFAKEESSYRIECKRFFTMLHHGEKIYLSCLERSFEKEIHRQIIFSI